MKIKQNLSLYTLALITLAFAVPTQAQSDWYVSGSGGATFSSDIDISGTLNGKIEYDPGYNLGIAFGGKINDNARGEIELSYRTADLDTITVNGATNNSSDVEIETAAVMINFYYDMNIESNLAPYITAGLGYGRQEVTFGSTSGSDTGFVYQVGAGANYAVSDTTNLFVDYRYFGSRDSEVNNVKFDGYSAHEIRVGVRFGF